MRYAKTIDLKFDASGSSEAQVKAATLAEYQNNAALVAKLVANESSSDSSSELSDIEAPDVVVPENIGKLAEKQNVYQAVLEKIKSAEPTAVQALQS